MATLFSWIGHIDLFAMCQCLPDEQCQSVLTEIQRTLPQYKVGPGAVKAMIDYRQYDRICLFSNYSRETNEKFRNWLGAPVEISTFSFRDPSSYEEIFPAVSKQIEILLQGKSPEVELSFLLSPGTPTMGVVWILIGMTRYRNYSFYQTYQGNVTRSVMPFELHIDSLPDMRSASEKISEFLLGNMKDGSPGQMIPGSSPAFKRTAERAVKAAKQDVPVLLSGESGTGKEILARFIMRESRLRDKPFICVNCASIPDTLIESELFGHKKGAFTGADRDAPGAFRAADGGTLFLDEIGEASPLLQSKLLRVLQPVPGKGMCHREFMPVGENKTVSVNVRIIAATNRDLLTAVEENRFRSDLYYRLAVISIYIPPLREREKDLLELAESFLKNINQEFRVQNPDYRTVKFSDGALNEMLRYPWPGNVRELYNVIMQAALLCENGMIREDDIAQILSEHVIPPKKESDILSLPLGGDFNLNDVIDEVRRHYIEKAMRESGGNKSKAAKLLGLRSAPALEVQRKRLFPETGKSAPDFGNDRA